ncbi:Xanthine uracil permease family [Penicillium digitatum]|uniref:Xanthine uracil permease family n=1 Tax=Penicillium digitatum TaxID=36651 RepID=A0A7T6XTE3_PENDI|nr:Xanthine uracil permease family [Penicillium digitatum]
MPALETTALLFFTTAKSLSSKDFAPPSESTSTSRHPRHTSLIAYLSICAPFVFTSTMAYYENRRYRDSRDRYPRPASYADPLDDTRGYYRRHEQNIYAPRASDDSIEEVRREYPSGSDYAHERSYASRRPRRPDYENGRRASSVSGCDSHNDAAYQSSGSHRLRHYEDQRSRRSKYDSDSSPSRSPPRNRRRRSFSEQALGALGLGGVAASASRDDRGRGRSQSHRRHRSYSRSSSDSRSRSRHRGSSKRDKSEQRIIQAARAALTAGAVEAFKQRKEPGEWAGTKGKRVLTAAITAGGTDGLVDKDPSKHGTRHVIESTLAGLAASHFIGGGSRSRSRGRDGGRSSGGRSLKNLAATGAIAAAGKEIFDRYSKSRSRPRGRSDSRGSDPGERGSRKRSKSVSDYITKGMTALGLGEGEDRHRDSRDRRTRDGVEAREISDEKKQRKKLKRDMLITGGLASVATIHAAHSLYNGVEKRKERMHQLKEGEITPEEARKLRMKANTKDAVSIGLAALGIKGAYGEWKEVMEKRKETAHFQEECLQRAAKRERRRARSQGAPSRRHHWPDEVESAPSMHEPRSENTPIYRDGNPYGAHDAPQISY